MTEWRPVAGYEGRYEVSDSGAVRSLDRVVDYVNGRRNRHPGRTLKHMSDKDGYEKVMLYGAQVKPRIFGVHRLVCIAWHGIPESPSLHAAHRDGDKLNNTPSNLYWATGTENELDKVKHGGNVQANKTHCPQGHEYTPANTWAPNRSGERASGNERWCLECKRKRDSEYQKANRAKATERNRRYRARKKLEAGR